MRTIRSIHSIALALALAAAAGCEAGLRPPVGGAAGAAASSAGAAERSAFQPPPVLADADPAPVQGVFDLTAGAQVVELAPGTRAEMYVYNGAYPGPTLDVREGEQVVVRFKNALPEPTSVHWHGLPVPADQDDALESIAPGATREYRFTVPAGSAGTYWYHPHLHGTVAKQVAMGLFGAVRVRAAEDPLPAELGDEIAVLSDPRIGADGKVLAASGAMELAMGVEGAPLVNGRAAPRLALRPGEARRFRFINASSARYYRLQHAGRPLTVVGTDGGLLERPVDLTEVVLAPGERAEVILRAPELAGGAPLTLLAAPYERGAMGGMGGGMTHRGLMHSGMPGPAMGGPAASGERLLEVVAEGAPTATPTIPAQLRAIAPFPAQDAAARTFTLSEDHGTADFRIDGRSFDPQRIDVTTRVGAAEVWTLANEGDMDHPFHLHGFAFQVLDRGGRPEAVRGWKDTVNLKAGEAVRIGVKFDGYPGLRVYHCHILEHEDRGMMGIIRVD